MSLHAILIGTCAMLLAGTAMAGVAYELTPQIKLEQMHKAAANAVQQQRTEARDATRIDASYAGVGGVTVETARRRDRNASPTLNVTVRDVAANGSHTDIPDRIEVRFDGPMNLRELGTGIAFHVDAPEGVSEDLRMGVHFKIQDGPDAVIISDTPVRQRFGDNPHEVYMDWGYAFDHTVRPMAAPDADVFEKVVGFDITFVQKRLPRESGVRLEPASGSFTLRGFRVVDYYHGSYDSARFPADGRINANSPLVSQGRTQQVARIAAKFGGEQGAQSAIAAMDMMARIQCWDGSWPEMRTRLQGEFTHGMILKDLAYALMELREQRRPELRQRVQIRHWDMTRDQLYEQMLYRGAMSRSPAPISSYADTYASGSGAWSSGANRPMVYVVAQWVAAQAMTDPARERELLEQYDINMKDLLAQQGASTAGRFPSFGEGNRFGGEGLRWDVSYTTDHVFIMALGSRVTDDPRWGEIMRKFDTVVNAMALPDGRQIDGALSERGRGTAGSLKAPDLVFQEALRHDATALAQWGANASRHQWDNWPTGLWAHAGSARGYNLGAFLTWLAYDMQPEPAPRDLGHVFPRQWPAWTAQWFDRQGEPVGRSTVILAPDGSIENNFAWEPGRYPQITGLPVAVRVDRPVRIEQVEYTGDVAAGRRGSVTLVAQPGSPQPAAMRDDTASLELDGPTDIELADARHDLTIRFRIRPVAEGQTVRVDLRLLRGLPE